jgi:hypothetical protein
MNFCSAGFAEAPDDQHTAGSLILMKVDEHA